MSLKHHIQRAVVLAALLLPTTVMADALKNFVNQIESLNSLEAAFTQNTRDANGRSLQQIQGMLSVAKPGKMRWETAAPYEQLIVSDGELLWIYDMDLEQVTIRTMGQSLQETPALLLSGDVSEVEKSFIVAQERSAAATVYQLVPKDKSQLFETLEFHYQKNTLQRMRIYDATGQVTDIQFRNVKLNQKMDSHAFIFDVPEGVDVIDGRNAL